MKKLHITRAAALLAALAMSFSACSGDNAANGEETAASAENAPLEEIISAAENENNGESRAETVSPDELNGIWRIDAVDINSFPAFQFAVIDGDTAYLASYGRIYKPEISYENGGFSINGGDPIAARMQEDGKLHFLTENETITMRRYTEEWDLTYEELEDTFKVYTLDSGNDIAGFMELRGGKGMYTALDTAAPAEISIDGKEITLDIGGKKTVYDTYLFDVDPTASERFIYLLNGKEMICLSSDIVFEYSNAAPIDVYAIPSSSPAVPVDMQSLEGDWYLIETPESVCRYTFNSDGTAVTDNGEEREQAEFTAENGLIELYFPEEDFFDRQSLAAVIQDGIMYIADMGINTEIVREEYFPIKDGQTVDEYFSELGENYMRLTREKPIPAEQRDVIGIWVARKYDDPDYEYEYRENLGIITEDGFTGIDEWGDINDAPIGFVNGRITEIGAFPENITLSDEDVYAWFIGDKIYMSTGVVMERYSPVTVTRELLDGAHMDYASDTFDISYFKGDTLYIYNPLFEEEELGIPYRIKDNKVILDMSDTPVNSDYAFDCYVTESCCYLISDGTSPQRISMTFSLKGRK